MLLEGIELSTSPLPRGCSTTELQQRRIGNAAAGYTARRAQRASSPPALWRLDLGWAGHFSVGMDKETDPEPRAQPAMTARAAAELAARRAREAAALRTNLRRRKQQGRAREQPQDDTAPR